MKVTNRSTGVTCYQLPELNIRRTFNPGEHKEIDEKELESLWQSSGGAYIIANSLQLEDKQWVKQHWDVPIEYFWGVEEAKNCVLNDSVELFSETLDYAPAGVIDIIKELSWKLPMTDLNKIKVLTQKTGFDPVLAAEIMKPMADDVTDNKTVRTTRLRREEV